MVAICGPEFVTGSTRLNAGTATKLILNMLSTTAMIQLEHVQGSSMVDMRLSNAKLLERGIRMIQKSTGADASIAAQLLHKHGSVRKAIDEIEGNAHA
jgi:N-acetylmuramic acid 6-phosphate etherase